MQAMLHKIIVYIIKQVKTHEIISRNRRNFLNQVKEKRDDKV